ncbi:MAG: TM1266 family iron-only hydrogenase system putative regulator [Saccharofermentanales bacterium]
MSAENEKISENRLGVVGIILESPDENVTRVNDILHDFAGIIVGRMGIPYRQRGVAVIALTVDGTTDEIGAMTGKIGQIKDVTVKTALAPKK